MCKICQVLLIVLVCFIMSVVFMSLGASNIQAAPNIKLIANPNKTEIQVGAKPIALTAQASGTELKFLWKLVTPGIGELKGKVTDSAIFYVPPQKINEDVEQTIVSVTVTDKSGEEATDSIVFIISKIPTIPTPTPTPTHPAPTPTPKDKIIITPPPKDKTDGCEAIKADGEVVEFYSVQENNPTWRQTWDFPKVAIKEAKKKGATEILVQQITKGEDGEYRLWRFGTDQNSGFYYASFLKPSDIVLGTCWKEVKQEANIVNISPDGKKHEIESMFFYVLTH